MFPGPTHSSPASSVSPLIPVPQRLTVATAPRGPGFGLDSPQSHWVVRCTHQSPSLSQVPMSPHSRGFQLPQPSGRSALQTQFKISLHSHRESHPGSLQRRPGSAGLPHPFTTTGICSQATSSMDPPGSRSCALLWTDTDITIALTLKAEAAVYIPVG